MKRINNRSKARERQEREYKKVKEEKQEWMIENKLWKCLLCNTRFKEDDVVDWHHTANRDKNNLSEWQNIQPVHRQCHTDFHQLSVGVLAKNPWYHHFLERLKAGAPKNKYFAKAFNNEVRRMQKGNLIDLEQQLKMTVDENI